MCDFKVGDEVVCVNAGRIDKALAWNPVIEGSKYTVSGIHMLKNEPHVTLSEVQNVFGGEDLGYRARRFRKVQRRDLTEWLSSSVGNTDKIDKRKRVNA